MYTNIFCLYLYILRMVAKSCTSTVTIRDSCETLGLLGLFHGMPSVHQGCRTTVSAIASHWDVTTGAWVWCRICGDATIFFFSGYQLWRFFRKKSEAINQESWRYNRIQSKNPHRKMFFG